MDRHSVVDDRLAITVALGALLFAVVTFVPVSYTHLTLPTIYSV